MVEPKNGKLAKSCLINVGVPQGSRLSCNAFNGVQDAILKRTQMIMHKALRDKNPTLAYEKITELNDILAFADDTLIYGQNLFDIKRSIDGISQEL